MFAGGVIKADPVDRISPGHDLVEQAGFLEQAERLRVQRKGIAMGAGAPSAVGDLHRQTAPGEGQGREQADWSGASNQDIRVGLHLRNLPCTASPNSCINRISSGSKGPWGDGAQVVVEFPLVLRRAEANVDARIREREPVALPGGGERDRTSRAGDGAAWSSRWACRP